MQEQLFNWETVFDTSNQTMSHNFKNAMSVVVNFKLKKCFTLRNGRIIDTIDFNSVPMSLDDYERHLIQTAKADEVL